MNGHMASTTDYAVRLDGFRQSDAERDTMVSELLAAYEKLKIQYTEKCEDYNNEVESRRKYQRDAKRSQLELSEQKQASGSSNFALAILDGDGAVFQDYLLAQGKEGGADAAHQLYTGLRNELKSMYPDSNTADWSILVHIALNMQGLGNKLQSCGVISSHNDLVAFARAFSLAQPLFNFIDVGSGKERADHKIRETLRLFLPNNQCKHIWFGPMHDNGYLPVLEPYRLDPIISARLTLIETMTPTPGFRQLGLRTTKFPRVFRPDELPVRSSGVTSSFQAALPPRTGTNTSAAPFSPAARTSPSPSPGPSADNWRSSSSWATIGKTGAPSKSIDIAPKKTPTRKNLMLNAHDERLDLPLPEQDSKAYQRFADKVKLTGNICNNYHLVGKCKSGEYCDYHHGEKLSPGELLVLKHKARSLACTQKSYCRNFNCFLGHHCKYGHACDNPECRFEGTHGNMDHTPAKRAFEDGTEEWLPSYLAQYST
ncbi:hypothetical protein LTR78_005410 [Recurvomyces mirabilis]|uniref:C3H1-type domain-containing protein n=1 Tax=Recurvomyces mirabilis TaxID=574656 RepID=A0AAE0WN51_9PEZI|nr:hypothetical protein LTR78_005410 [Recurvomyces mirabilis]KAK5152684.1 hypothetical protein LTS14_008218 [Recurvomyces mirabilis]